MSKKRAIKRIIALGGKYDKTGVWPFGHVTYVRLAGILLNDGMKVNDDDMALMGNLDQLENLDISFNPVTNKGIQHLTGLKKLRVLDLSHTKISDKGLACLKELPLLENLVLNGTRVSSRGISAIKDMPKLEFLMLWETKVSESVQQPRRTYC